MPVNAVNHAPQNNPNANFAPNKSSSSQANLFSKQLDTNNTNNTLQQAADDSGLSTLANDENTDSWHSVMGQTFGYDQNDPESEGYQQSEEIRAMVNDGAWEGLDISVSHVKGDLGAEAAFVGGDTADVSDDQILINNKTSETSKSAVTEELFHAFERKINPEQEGDTRLVDGVATFTNDENASALDEGELGRALLAEFKQNGTVPTTLSGGILEAGGITSEDTNTISLNSNDVSVEFSIDAPFWDVINSKSNDELNTWLASSEPGYADKEDLYLSIINSNQPGTGLTVSSLLERDTVDGTRGITEGVQDYIGWAMENYPEVKAEMVEFLETRTIDFLNHYGNGQLNGEEADKEFNVDIWKYAPPSQLLNLQNSREATATVQDALSWQIENGGSDAIAAALDEQGRANFINSSDMDSMDDYFSAEFSEILGPRPRSHDSISPLDVGSSELQQKYQPLLGIYAGAHPYTAVDANGNWNAGLNPSGSPTGLAESNEHGQAYARTLNGSATESLPDNVTAIQYSYYFPKDTGNVISETGHRHDWEDAWVFIENAGQDDETMLGAAYSAHGRYTGRQEPEANGDQIKVQYAYHDELAGDGITHSFAEAGSRELRALEKQDSDYTDNQTLAAYGWLPDEAKDTLQGRNDQALENGFDNFGSAVVPFKDSDFEDNAAAAFYSVYHDDGFWGTPIIDWIGGL